MAKDREISPLIDEAYYWVLDRYGEWVVARCSINQAFRKPIVVWYGCGEEEPIYEPLEINSRIEPPTSSSRGE